MRGLLLVALVVLRSSAFTTHFDLRRPTKLNFLSPAMSGFLAKTFNGKEYETIVIETMQRENCGREEAEERYNYYLYGASLADPLFCLASERESVSFEQIQTATPS